VVPEASYVAAVYLTDEVSSVEQSIRSGIETPITRTFFFFRGGNSGER
jgi:hypothetical protein